MGRGNKRESKGEMNLLDSSAIINLAWEKKFDPLLEGKTITLAVYEVGNAIWKQVSLRESITKEEGEFIFKSLVRTMNEMEIIILKDHEHILDLAIGEGITYYDASYIQAAIQSESRLVTDDKKLASAADKYVETSNSMGL